MDTVLFVIFLIHFGVALSLFIKRKRIVYIILMGVFLSLIISLLIRIFSPEFLMFGFQASLIFRYTAIGLSVISISIIIFSRIRQNREQ